MSRVELPTMNYKEIIGASWSYTQEHKKMIFWLGFLPSVVTTIFSIGYFTYQFLAFRLSPVFGGSNEEFFEDILGSLLSFFSENSSMTIPVILLVILYAFLYVFFPSFAKAGSIQKIARDYNGQEIGIFRALRYGFMPFLRLLQLHVIIKTFALVPLLALAGSVARNFGLKMFGFFLPIFILMFLIGILLTVLFTYADFYIVIDDEGVFESLKKSSALVTTHLKHTFLVAMLMMIIGVRVVIQAIMVFLIPAVIVLVMSYFASIALPSIGYTIGGGLGLLGLTLSAYLSGVVDVFSYTVWTRTFLMLSEESELSARDKVDA